MAVIRVPKPPKKAFNTNRRVSALLLRQIEHLEWAALPASQRKPRQLPKQRVTTEGQAAERVAQLTMMVMEAKSKPAATHAVAPVTLPPLPSGTGVTAKRPSRKRETKASRKTLQRKVRRHKRRQA